MLQSILIRVLFVITGLHTGGAEMMLWKLLSRLHGRTIEAAVVSLSGPGAISNRISALGVKVWHIGLEHPFGLPSAVWQLSKIARLFEPDVVQGWMYHGNLAASWIRVCAPNYPLLFWSIRQSLNDLNREKSGTRVVIKLGSRLSHHADGIFYNSEVSKIQHEKIGYKSFRAQVIDNGFDTEQFKPDSAQRTHLRNELNIPDNAMLVGMIARFHAMKGHEVFFQAAALLASRMPEVHFVPAGRDIEPNNPKLALWLNVSGLAKRVHLLGERQDIPGLTAALDVACSSSLWGEAFPNTIGEAMSCAVPCVATDVGDVRRIIGKTGEVIPVNEIEILAASLERILRMPEHERGSMGEEARKRIQNYFSLEKIVGQYAELYKSVA